MCYLFLKKIDTRFYNTTNVSLDKTKRNEDGKRLAQSTPRFVGVNIMIEPFFNYSATECGDAIKGGLAATHKPKRCCRINRQVTAHEEGAPSGAPSCFELAVTVRDPN